MKKIWQKLFNNKTNIVHPYDELSCKDDELSCKEQNYLAIIPIEVLIILISFASPQDILRFIISSKNIYAEFLNKQAIISIFNNGAILNNVAKTIYFRCFHQKYLCFAINGPFANYNNHFSPQLLYFYHNAINYINLSNENKITKDLILVEKNLTKILSVLQMNKLKAVATNITSAENIESSLILLYYGFFVDYSNNIIYNLDDKTIFDLEIHPYSNSVLEEETEGNAIKKILYHPYVIKIILTLNSSHLIEKYIFSLNFIDVYFAYKQYYESKFDKCSYNEYKNKAFNEILSQILFDLVADNTQNNINLIFAILQEIIDLNITNIIIYNNLYTTKFMHYLLQFIKKYSVYLEKICNIKFSYLSNKKVHTNILNLIITLYLDTNWINFPISLEEVKYIIDQAARIDYLSKLSITNSTANKILESDNKKLINMLLLESSKKQNKFKR